MLRRFESKVLLMVIIIFNVLGLCTIKVNADMGPKPSLTIYVENYKNSNYYLDLLGKEGEYGYNTPDGNKRYDSMHDIPIYNYNKDGWKAIHMRTWLLFGDLVGKYDDKSGKMVHEFSYIGVPKKFKIIVQKDDGSLQVSKVITNNYFYSEVNYDMSKNTYTIKGTVEKHFSINKNSLLPDNFFTRCLFTIVIELLLGLYLFKIKNWKIIIIANLITQIILNLVVKMFATYSPLEFLLSYIILENLIVLIEFIIYAACIKNIRKRKLFLFSFVANLSTLLLGMLLL